MITTRPNLRALALLYRSAWALKGGFCAYTLQSKISRARQFVCGSMNHTYETLPMSIHMWALKFKTLPSAYNKGYMPFDKIGAL